ncbi:MAG TPA: hypothetical protein VL947_03550, partial [Cytophagales bacterium]|nr:hypothetical protein [Cytophagales bacterium]
GEGMFRKDPNAILEWTPNNVEICYKRQRRILTEINGALKPGGYLIYSTCTYNQQEDEGNIQWFLENNDYEEIRLTQEYTGVMECEYGYKFLPHLIDGEGFYVCCLKKRGAMDDFEFYKSKHSNLDTFKSASEVRTYLKPEQNVDFYTFNGTIKALHPYHKIVTDYISKRLNIITAGLDIAEQLKNKQLVPLHSLAMSRLVNLDTFPSVDLDKVAALKFLRKELLDIDCDNGLHLATYMGIPLGFFKKIQNRINNNYPQEWRIRMGLQQ